MSNAAAGVCTTVHVRVSPPPATITPPVRAVVPAFVATRNVTIPLLVPEVPPVTVSHETFDETVHEMFAVTAIVRPVQAKLVKFVLAGLMTRAGANPVPEADLVFVPLVLSEFTVIVPL